MRQGTRSKGCQYVCPKLQEPEFRSNAVRHTDFTDLGGLDREPRRKRHLADKAFERCATRCKTIDEIGKTCDGRDKHARVLGVCCGCPVPALAA